MRDEGDVLMIEFLKDADISEYESFLSSHPKGHFMQSALWARQKPQWVWDGVISRGEDGSIRGSAAVLIRRLPGLPWTLMYGGRAPVCDIHDREVLGELFAGLRSLAKKYRAYLIKLDPDIPSDDEQFRRDMISFGFKVPRAGKNFEGIQPRFVFRLYLLGRSQEELLASFHTKTRYNIRLAERKGVRVEVRGEEAVDDFARLMLETGVRDGFVTRNADYFRAMLKNLGDNARLYMAYYGDVPIAGTIAVHYGDKVWYLYGASSNEWRNLMPNYLLQWRMICWAIELGCRVYDFRGVSGDLSEDNPLYGLYKFKKGFNGEFTEFVGEFDMKIKPLVCFAVSRGTSLFMKLRKTLYIIKHRGAAPSAAKEEI
ncbi:MAG: peptidoglycan bridge formation glycyltransferase FemA/FemB family protein [Clostridiales bacterium]|jgi:lipid II:glycine glycyltransferase (peptidoglycan interpeptide bridge formation enzyme)|nr:peptidoglycan bridge formation glycyltransferase FemA/FemB family protein [Clostridiales bacterium]